jgi:hypothetical protein
MLFLWGYGNEPGDRQSQMPQSTIRKALILYESSTVHLPF